MDSQPTSVYKAAAVEELEEEELDAGTVEKKNAVHPARPNGVGPAGSSRIRRITTFSPC